MDHRQLPIQLPIPELEETRTMAEEFVKKDVCEANIRRMDQRFDATETLINNTVERMEAIMERNLAKHENIAERLEKKFDILNTRLEGRFDTMNARFDTLQNKFSWNLAWVGIIMGLVLAIVQHFWK